MEAFPAEYVEHNLPLVILSGLEQVLDNTASETSPQRLENGTRIQGVLPSCGGERAQSLLQQFQELDGSKRPWNASSLPGPAGVVKYKIKAIGRSYVLPPRKAAPLPQSPSTEGFPSQHGPTTKTELHSPLSPLSPGSPIFPDGVFTPLWVSKHQHQVPALFLAFFNISVTDSKDQDEKLKADINAAKSALSRSGFKTRFAVVLLSDRSIVNAPELDERLSSIRRLTSLDSKTGLLFMPPMSSRGEIATFVHSVMIALQPSCLEYYRDLTKHARRKKAKGAPSPSFVSVLGGTPLPATGWNVRYEVKQGVFAEFRQEMDVAERHYSTAIDELFLPDGILVTAQIGSPRWHEARLLSDCLALRILRCQLWDSSTTGAVQSWLIYMVRMRDIIDRRGLGSESYAWEAWEARWAEVMAQLVQRAELPSLQKPQPKASDDVAIETTLQVYAPPEKAFAAAERLLPFQSLHHSGYWMRTAAQRARDRRKRALAISKEDRVPPGQLPASMVANRTNYDLYLVPSPDEEYAKANRPADELSHARNIERLAKETAHEFHNWNQHRMSEVLNLERGRDLMLDERFEEAVQLLQPLWEQTSWRTEDWYGIFIELLHILRRCAHELDKTELLVATAYELLCISSIADELKPGADEAQKSEDPVLPAGSEAVSLVFQNDQRLCPIAVSFAFASSETYVGEALQCQLRLRPISHSGATALSLNDITLTLDSSRTVRLVHEASREQLDSEIVELTLDPEGQSKSLEVEADLSLEDGQQRTFNFYLPFRAAGTVSLKEAVLDMNLNKSTIKHKFTDGTVLSSNSLQVRRQDGQVEQVRLPHAYTTVATVLPKPPKVKVLVHGLQKQYYTDEHVRLTVEVINEEIQSVEGTMRARVEGEIEGRPLLRWADEDTTPRVEVALSDNAATSDKAISELNAGASRKTTLLLKAPREAMDVPLIVDVDYSLPSDRSTGLKKTTTLELSFVMPFEVKFNFGPLLYTGQWPSYFDPTTEDTIDDAGGIPQRWILSAQVHSLASRDINLQDVQQVIDQVAGDSNVKVAALEPLENSSLSPGAIARIPFELQTQKYALDDRRPTAIESTLAVTWSCAESAEPSTTHLPIPRLSLPVSEPRVLCSLAEDQSTEGCDALVQYHIENPSTHFLTFALTMEASEDFAFSGPKYRTLSLAPLSRHKVEYRLSLHDDDGMQFSPEKEGGRWIWPSLQVIDSYYQKTLRVHPGGPGVKFDEKQNIAVWIEG